MFERLRERPTTRAAEICGTGTVRRVDSEDGAESTWEGVISCVKAKTLGH